LPPVGIDRGITVFAALSNGVMIASANHGKKALKALARKQREAAKRKRWSFNRRKRVCRIARLHMRVHNARKNYLHQSSTNIANNHGIVVLEKLEVRNMVRSATGSVQNPGKNVRQKSGLNRSILDQGWGMFREMLKYKLPERGGKLIEVSPRYTSQTCSVCGVVDARSRFSQSRFVCTSCGHEANADENAAVNILRRRDTPVRPVEVARRSADESGTTRRAA
jgi:putative transposase